MKKVFVVLMVLLLPLSAMAAMTSITDNELAEVNGQVGIDISLVDFNMDMTIASFTYDDTDVGTITISNVDVGYHAGYLNVKDLSLENIYITMNATPIYASTVTGQTLLNELAVYEATGAGNFSFVAAHPLTIDVASVDNDAAFYYSRGKSGILIGIPDMFISLDGIDINGVYFDDTYGDATGSYNPYAEKFTYESTYDPDSSKSIGSFHIKGITLTMYSSVAKTTYVTGTTSFEVTAGPYTTVATQSTTAVNMKFRSPYRLNGDGAPVRFYEGNRAYLLINPH